MSRNPPRPPSPDDVRPVTPWELAARYSWVDLTSGGIPGGVLEDATLGVNWYWNYNYRMQFNYVRALRNATNPASIGGDVDAFVMRFSFDI